MLTATIVGAAGYTGGELLRLLLGHPSMTPVQGSSRRLAGRPVHSVHPHLRGATDLRFQSDEELEASDLVFLCRPHGEAAAEVERWLGRVRLVVDLSADFRLRDPQLHERWYAGVPAAPELRRRFVYGLPELRRRELAGAEAVAGVGCNATAVVLALAPLAREGLVERVVADVKVGSSEAGAKASAASHHPLRSGAVRSFAPVGHRHQGEICQELGLEEGQLSFSATSVERVRGVLATCHVFPRRPLDDREVLRLYQRFYGEEPFVRLVRDRGGLHRFPDPKVVAGTNFCDLGWAVDEGGRRLVVLSALDNLVKGAAGSAVQAANVACGLPETAGLGFLGLFPA